ncbi:unnamed protein product, partial [Chrysoparadoxa australica]
TSILAATRRKLKRLEVDLAKAKGQVATGESAVAYLVEQRECDKAAAKRNAGAARARAEETQALLMDKLEMTEERLREVEDDRRVMAARVSELERRLVMERTASNTEQLLDWHVHRRQQARVVARSRYETAAVLLRSVAENELLRYQLSQMSRRGPASAASTGGSESKADQAMRRLEECVHGGGRKTDMQCVLYARCLELSALLRATREERDTLDELLLEAERAMEAMAREQEDFALAAAQRALSPSVGTPNASGEEVLLLGPEDACDTQHAMLKREVENLTELLEVGKAQKRELVELVNRGEGDADDAALDADERLMQLPGEVLQHQLVHLLGLPETATGLDIITEVMHLTVAEGRASAQAGDTNEEREATLKAQADQLQFAKGPSWLEALFPGANVITACLGGEARGRQGKGGKAGKGRKCRGVKAASGQKNTQRKPGRANGGSTPCYYTTVETDGARWQQSSSSSFSQKSVAPASTSNSKEDEEEAGAAALCLTGASGLDTSQMNCTFVVQGRPLHFKLQIKSNSNGQDTCAGSEQEDLYADIMAYDPATQSHLRITVLEEDSKKCFPSEPHIFTLGLLNRKVQEQIVSKLTLHGEADACKLVLLGEQQEAVVTGLTAAEYEERGGMKPSHQIRTNRLAESVLGAIRDEEKTIEGVSFVYEPNTLGDACDETRDALRMLEACSTSSSDEEGTSSSDCSEGDDEEGSTSQGTGEEE